MESLTQYQSGANTDTTSLGDTNEDTEDSSTTETGSDSESVANIDSENDTDNSLGQENTAAKCSDSEDNDGDNLRDCADPDCLGKGSCECQSGDRALESCGSLCGEAEKTCVDGAWGPLGLCQNEGVCVPGTPDEQQCGTCQVKSRSCKSDCTWSKWGACESAPGCSSCGGTLHDSHCWYLGGFGQSCQDVCAGHGGYASITSQYVGTTAQGGSLAKCQALFTALGNKGTVNPGVRYDGIGLGCHRWEDGVLWWLESPNFQSGHSSGGGQVVCACSE